MTANIKNMYENINVFNDEQTKPCLDNIKKNPKIT